MAKHRRNRTKGFGIQPIPPRLLNAKPADFSVEHRLDGPTNTSGIHPGRQRKSKGPTPDYSIAQEIQKIVACDAFWTLAKSLDSNETHHSRSGRPRKCGSADVLIFVVAISALGSARAVHRFFRDPVQWKLICDTAVTAYPDDPTRRLSPKGITRYQFDRYRRKHVEFEHAIREFQTQTEKSMAEIARDTEMFDSSQGSWTEPATQNIVVSDATWIASPYNSSSPTYTDPKTGEIIPVRYDPDATPYRDNTQANGNMLVSVIARNSHPNERLILSLDYKPHTNMSDATLAVDMTLRIFPLIPEIQGFVYDMALYANDYDRLLSAGILPISKVQRTRTGKVAMFNLNEHEFTLTNGTKKNIVVHAVDGTPRIELLIGDEIQSVGLIRIRTSRSKNRTGTYRIYGTWQIPDFAGISPKLRNATTQIRHNSTDTEIANNTPRTRALRVIPETDKSFDRYYGLREDTESMHHHLKTTMTNRRARSVGRHRQLFEFIGYQIALATKTLLAWHHRTGSDISRWFGQWKPPNHAAKNAA